MLASSLLFVLLVSEGDAAKDDDSGSPLPVTSITAFKDGHALVIREGRRAVNDAGVVRLDGLPEPLLGSFWPYATDNDVTLRSATATRWSTKSTRSATSLAELLRENIGKRLVGYNRLGDSTAKIDATIVAVEGPHVIVEATVGDTKRNGIVPIDKLEGVAIVGEMDREVDSTVQHTGLQLQFTDDKGCELDDCEAGIGLLYVQKGFRWIPHYRLAIKPDGTAKYVLRATLVNDLVDIEQASVNLVVGVPMFQFAGMKDPIHLASNVAQLGVGLRSHTMRNQTSNDFDSNLFSNAIRTQVVSGRSQPSSAPPQVTGGAKAEDLFVFSLENVSLKVGERMSIEIARGTLKTSDRYEIDLPILPPQLANSSSMQAGEYSKVATLLAKPSVMHRIEVENAGGQPLTTAPVLMFQVNGDGNETLLAQSMLTYTPAGGTSTIDLGTAVDVSVRFEEEETNRTADPITHDRYKYEQVDFQGTITVVNSRAGKTPLRIRRYVPGSLDSASDGGKTKALAPFDTDDGGLSELPVTRGWWYRYYPSWYASLNPTSRAEWKFETDAGSEKKLTYTWHYVHRL